LLTLGIAGAGAKLTAGCAIGWTAIWTFGCGGGGATCALACAFGCGAMLVFCGAGGATVALKSAGVYARRNALRIWLNLAVTTCSSMPPSMSLASAIVLVSSGSAIASVALARL